MARESKLAPQPWPWTGPRVLVENPDPEAGLATAEALRRSGLAVAICPGPARSSRCPLAGDDGCATAHGADAVVSSLGFESPEARETLAALRARVSPRRLIVEADAQSTERWPELLEGCTVVPAPAQPGELLESVRTVLEREPSRA